MGKFYYEMPKFKYNKEGNMEIIRKLCVGPIEAIIYGINKDKGFYLDWTYPEFYPGDSELENDYEIISKERIIKAIESEILECEKNGNKEIIDKYRKAIKMIEKDEY